MVDMRVFFSLCLVSCTGVAAQETEADPDASCTPEQVDRCKSAAHGGHLHKLGAGGRCEKQQYVHYTHTCTLNIYLPDVDYCCCAYNKKVLCCRYWQAHDRYRCSQPEDTIATLSAHGTGGLSNGDHISDRWPGLPLKYLLPAILVPIVILGCCLVCCVKCCLHNEDCDEIRNCWRNKDKKKTLEIEETSSPGFHASYPYPSHHGHLALGQFEREPLNNPTPNQHFHQMIMPMEQPKRPLDELMEADRLMPSAPGPADLPHDDTCVPYMRSVSAPPPPPSSDVTSGMCCSSGDMSQMTSLDSSGATASQHLHPQHPHTSVRIHFMHHPHSYPGPGMDREDSAPLPRDSGASTSTPGAAGDRGSQCPNCSAQPPTYRESFQHPVMDQRVSQASNQGESPPYTPPESPDKS